VKQQTITGYDADKRELWEIPEVKKYITKLLNKKPQILYYLDLKLWSILCYSSTLSTTNKNGQAQVAIDKNKVIGNREFKAGLYIYNKNVKENHGWGQPMALGEWLKGKYSDVQVSKVHITKNAKSVVWNLRNIKLS